MEDSDLPAVTSTPELLTFQHLGYIVSVINLFLEAIFELRYNKLLSREVTIKNDLGIHARPAAMIAKLAQKAEKAVWIDSGDNKADASSIIDILTIGGHKGSSLMLVVESENDINLLNSILQLIENGFGENIDE